MKLIRRQFLSGRRWSTPALSLLASAQTYPSLAVHLIVGYARRNPDIACLIGQWLSGSLVSHSSSRTGRLVAISAPKQRCTRRWTAILILLVSGERDQRDAHDKLSYNFIRDAAPVAGIIRVPNVMEMNPQCR